MATKTTNPGYIDNKDELLNRLRRISGQVGGLERMVEDERYCIDILTQVSAIQAALDKVSLELLDDHACHCVIGDRLEPRGDDRGDDGRGRPADPQPLGDDGRCGRPPGRTRSRRASPSSSSLRPEHVDVDGLAVRERDRLPGRGPERIRLDRVVARHDEAERRPPLAELRYGGARHWEHPHRAAEVVLPALRRGRRRLDRHLELRPRRQLRNRDPLLPTGVTE